VETIGFIGLGSIGGRIASNIGRAGFPLVVHDIREEAMAPFAEKGATLANSGREVAAQSDVIFTSLPGPVEVELVARGPNGILEGIRPGSTYIDLSTRRMEWICQIEPDFDKKGAAVLEAPLSVGGDPRFGRICAELMIGGDPAVYERMKPILLSFSDRLIYCGGLGAGTVCKLTHNMIGNSVRLAIAEGIVMAAKAGVDALVAWECLRHGVVGRAAVGPMAVGSIKGNFENTAGGGFSFALARKDLALATELAKSLNVPVGVHMATEAVASQAMNRGFGDKNPMGGLYLMQEEIAGVQARNPAADLNGSPDFITVHPDLLSPLESVEAK
jgi:3-hydroxyisobutyrate dehydrogenase-like beta-hydroxyacid dehydrogenase